MDRLTVALTLFATGGGAVAAESLGGSGGWFGAGLLGAVLAWLCGVHLPAKDKQIKEMLEAKDSQAATLLAANDRRVDALQATFKAAVEAVVRHCEDEMRLVDARMDARHEADRADRHDWLEKVNANWLKAAVAIADAQQALADARPARRGGAGRADQQ